MVSLLPLLASILRILQLCLNLLVVRMSPSSPPGSSSVIWSLVCMGLFLVVDWNRYVGFATVGIFVYWYLFDESEDHHPLVTFTQLTHFHTCPSWTNFVVCTLMISTKE